MTDKQAGASLSAGQFYSQLHPELRERLADVLSDLREKGWKPRVPQLGGDEATGFRSLAAQAKEQAKKRSDVPFGFHNITTPAGQPHSMAVHVTDSSQYGTDKALKKQFQLDLLSVAERYGMTTGLYWKAKNKRGQIVDRPDELHVQLGENRWLGNTNQLAGLKQGKIPSLPAPLIIQPRISRAMAEGFTLKSIFRPPQPSVAKSLWAPPKPPTPPPPIIHRNFDPAQRMTLTQPMVGREMVKPQPWSDITRHPFRAVDRPFTKPTGFSDLTLRRPEVRVGGGFANFGNNSFKLSMQGLGSGMGLGSKSVPSLGNFQLKLNNF